jgi:ketosteroid isomerase-like protein
VMPRLTPRDRTVTLSPKQPRRTVMLRVTVGHHVRRGAVALVFAILVGVGLPSWHGPAELARAQVVEPGDRAAVITGFLTALNNGDLDGAMTFFADNAVFVGAARSGGTCTQTTPCTDSAGIRQQLQNAVLNSHTCFTLRGLTVSGAVVTGQRETRNDVTRRNGIDRDIEDFFALVPTGQITFWAGVKNVGDPETALDLAISAGTQPAGTLVPAPDTPCGPA